MAEDNALKPFEGHDHFDDLMRGSRRKSPLPITAPAITWHEGFWIPDGLIHKPDDWTQNIEKFIIALHRRLRDKGYAPVTPSLRKGDGKDDPEQFYLLDNYYPVNDIKIEKLKPAGKIGKDPARLQNFRVSFTWHSLRVQFDLEKQEEYFTLSSSIDLSEWKLQPAHKGTPAAVLNDAVETLKRVATARYTEVRSGRGEINRKTQQAELSSSYDDIYYNLWEALKRDVFEGLLPGDTFKNLGRAFVDFRGLVINQGENGFIASPGNMRPGQSLEQRIGDKRFAEKDALHYVDTLSPFMANEISDAGKLADEKTRLDPIQSTGSLFVGKRVIHMTALGAQPLEMQQKKRPLTQLLFCANNDPEQLGRLIDRTNSLATKRIAALYDFPELIAIGAELLRLENYLATEISPGLAQVTSEPIPESERARIFTQLTKNLSKFSKDLDAAAQKIKGGLLRRIMLSRHYRKQFGEYRENLRISRIEGLSPYDEAVNWRVSDNLDVVDEIGDRFKRLQDVIPLISNQLQMAESVETTRTSAKMLQLGDFGFWQIIFPVYGPEIPIKMIEKYPVAEHFIKEWVPNYEFFIRAALFLVGTGAAHRKRIARSWGSAKQFTWRKLNLAKSKAVQFRARVSRTRLAMTNSLSRKRKVGRQRYSILRYRLVKGRWPAYIRRRPMSLDQ